VPYLVTVAAVMGWFIGSMTGVAVHVLFLGHISMLLLPGVTWSCPTSLPRSRRRNSHGTAPPRSGGSSWSSPEGQLGPIFRALVVYPSVIRTLVAAVSSSWRASASIALLVCGSATRPSTSSSRQVEELER
jgi:hypothetical protein